ncbi:MAG TPA: serine/threonine-protein kinase, partial [Planctomycetota bacterium]|nr:serine/threonine-protein kinase [Planctomycetota bacterium]
MPESLEEIQDRVLERLHAGEPLDAEALVAAHPEHADALRRFLAVLALVEQPPEPREVPPSRLGEFRIVREIGRGGMGVVYEAEQASLRRRVALKVLPAAMRGDPAILARFRREAEAAARLRHPGIVPVYSFGEVGGTPFFAMELVEGGDSLAERIRARRAGHPAGAPTEPAAYRRWAVETIARMADALAYAHSRGILHRDVKPANVILERDGTPRLTDFGLALDLEATSLTVPGESFGSPLYMSPEQAFRREEPLDERTDVYSLAVTLYELLLLRLPYPGTLRSEVFSALQTGRIVPPRDVDPTLPEDLQRVLLKALRREPRERYAGVAEFAADLRAVLEQRRPAVESDVAEKTPVVAASMTGPAGASARRRPSRRMLWILAALAVITLPLILFGTCTALWLAPRGPEAPRPEMPPPGARAPRGVPPDRLEPDSAAIEALAAGTHPQGEETIRRWLSADVRQRRVLARDASTQAQLDVVVPTPTTVPEGILVLPIWEVSVDGGPWRVPSYDFRPIPVEGLPAAQRGSTSSAAIHYFAIQLSDLIPPQGRSIQVAHRVTLLVRRGDESAYAPGHLPDPARDLSSGTPCTFHFGPDSLYVYDSWPDDYPAAITDPATDEAMRSALRPSTFRLLTLGPQTLLAELLYPEPLHPRPLPVACEVDLLPPQGTHPIAAATLVA